MPWLGPTRQEIHLVTRVVTPWGWPLIRRERAKFLSLFRWERGEISRKFRGNFEISRKKGLNFAKFRENSFSRKRAEISQKNSRNKGKPQFPESRFQLTTR
jgi:hypothetical protein